ncbi:hypothetical protein GR702_04695 [Novosphingobium sp. FGD1]|uniref:Uncharacterized protein n=1 Tax=Novosphingobium silvae TaxID=2692619 RepID=A0A7X4K5L4_9SPHN|nr:hypothetical protein [Novosphingobium silvae]MYL97071.1 hypothetical protein [Novosphingobium silvae]
MPKRYPTTEEKREQGQARIMKIATQFPEARFKPLANNMAAGSCKACRAAARKSYIAADVPLMPLDGCPHPDQCVDNYRTIM